LLAAFFHSQVLAKDHILEKAWWTDTTGTATFDQARLVSYSRYDSNRSEASATHCMCRCKSSPDLQELAIGGDSLHAASGL
jgi:hypothetical protein